MFLGIRVRKIFILIGKINAKKVKKRNFWLDDEFKLESDLEEVEFVVILRDFLFRRVVGIVIYFIFILLYMIIDLFIWFSSINSVNKVLNYYFKER